MESFFEFLFKKREQNPFLWFLITQSGTVPIRE